jgi:hypothetical protein
MLAVNAIDADDLHGLVAAADEAGGTDVTDTRCVLDPVSVPAGFADLPAGCAYSGTDSQIEALAVFPTIALVVGFVAARRKAAGGGV